MVGVGKVMVLRGYCVWGVVVSRGVVTVVVGRAGQNERGEDEEKEYSCHECDTDLTEDEVTWATDDGVLTMNGNPYCDGCLPEEKEEEVV